MKRTERHHLKDNELATMAASAQRLLETRRSLVTTVVLVVAVVAASAFGYRAWRDRAESRAQALLSEAIVTEETRVGPPPAPGAAPSSEPSFATVRERNEAALAKLQTVADQYAGTDAARLARYKSAAILMELGRPQDAAAAYQSVIDNAPAGLAADMARLGLAQAQTQAGDHDKAIGTYKTLAERKDGPLPVEGVLVELGRAYLSAGRIEDAQQTFNRVIDEYPNSPFVADARRELDGLKKT